MWTIIVEINHTQYAVEEKDLGMVHTLVSYFSDHNVKVLSVEYAS